MAGLKRRAGHVWPEERGEQEHGLYSLHRMFDIVGAHLTHRDVRVLSFLFVDVIDDHERGLIRNGRDFLLALERQGRCDESNFRQVLQLLRIITRHDLLPYVTLKRRRAGEGAWRAGGLREVCGGLVVLGRGNDPGGSLGGVRRLLGGLDHKGGASLPEGLPPLLVCPDLVDKYLEETSIRYVTPRALSDPEPRPPQSPKTGKNM